MAILCHELVFNPNIPIWELGHTTNSGPTKLTSPMQVHHTTRWTQSGPNICGPKMADFQSVVRQRLHTT